MQTKYFVTVNPNSGAKKAQKDWPKIKQLLTQNGLDFDYKLSTKANENEQDVTEAIANGYRKIIGVGGDGTMHHIVNAICKQNKVPSNEIEVALISVGTGNDWVRHHQFPRKYEKAIAAIKRGKTMTQDVGQLIYHQQQTEYFMNFVGIGYDAYVVENTLSLKKYGQSAYLFGLLKCLFQFHPQELSITIDNKHQIDSKVFMMIAGIGQFAGGGMKLAKHALSNDGYFDLTIGKDLTKTNIIFLVHKLFDGSFSEHHKVETFRCKSIKVSAKNQTIVKAEADGELIGIGPFEINILPQQLTIIAP